MKLTTPSGELTLPSDFSFEIEQNSAFFSEEGAASVAATIPATPADKAKLGFPSRLGRKSRFVNIIPATLQQGIYQKTGQLIGERGLRDFLKRNIRGRFCRPATQTPGQHPNQSDENRSGRR